MATNEPAIEGIKESVDTLIMKIARSVNGVGTATAGMIAADFEGNLQEFLAADIARLSQIKNSKDKQVLSTEQIDELIKSKAPLPQRLSLEESWVFYLGREFLKSQVEMLVQLKFENLDINPLLAKGLNLDTPEKIIVFNLYQTITRSVVTSWGDTVESIAKFTGCKDNDYIIKDKKGTNFDLMKSIKNVDYYIQIKSGPNSMNVGMVTSLGEAISELERERPGAKGLLGITYGTKDRLSDQIGHLRGGKEKILIGRDFWDFISEKKDFYKDLFNILDNSSTGILNKSFIELIDEKIKEFKGYWENKYKGLSVEQVLERYI